MPRGRRRMIWDTIFSSGDLCDLPAAARWLWLGLIIFADDSGLVRENVHFFQRTILFGLRVSRERIRSWLALFEARGMLASCNLNGVTYYQITNFFSFQKLKFPEGKNKDLRNRTCTLSAGRTQKMKIDGDHQALSGHFQSHKSAPPNDPTSKVRGKRREGKRRGGDALSCAESHPPGISRHSEASGEAPKTVVEWYSRELCMDPPEAEETVHRLGVTEADLEGWQQALEDARKQGLRDPRSYVRSRALRWRSADEAFPNGKAGRPDADQRRGLVLTLRSSWQVVEWRGEKWDLLETSISSEKRAFPYSSLSTQELEELAALVRERKEEA